MNGSLKMVSVVLSYNHPKRLLACLRSLREQDYPNHEVVVVDNASTEDPTAQVQGLYPEAHVIRMPRNEGFTGGMNRGMVWALEQKADLVFCLNDDVTFHPGCLVELEKAAVKRPLSGILCPWIYDPGSPPRIYSAGVQVDPWGRTTHLLSNQAPPRNLPQPYECVAATGCALMITRALLYETGGFDGRFFMYYEETDLCRRALEAGFQVWTVPQASVVHHTLPQNQEERGYIIYLMWRNRLLYLGNRGSTWMRTTLILFQEALPRFLSWSLRPRWRRRRGLIRPMALGIWHALTHQDGPPPPNIMSG